MKALVLTEYQKLEIKEVPTPEIGKNEVLIRVKACGICGSDIHGYDGSTGRRRPPIIMGHEASGVIEKLGSAVSGWQVGDRVTFDSTIYCDNCTYCRSGQVNLCENRRVLGVSCEDYRRDGAFAEYVAVPQHILYRIPDEVTFEQAALVEPLSVALHAVNLSPRAVNASAVVIGAGMVGQLVIQVLRATGYGTIIAVDHNEDRLDMARRYGADHGLLANADTLAEIKRLTNSEGANIAFEVVGVNESVNLAINAVRKGGAVTIIGNISPKVEIPLQAVVTRQIRLQGSCASSGEYPACLDFIARKMVDVNPVISESVPLEDGAEWFNTLYNKREKKLKIVLKP